MFAALRRAWQRYVASIPASPKDELVSDTDAMHELHPPPDRDVVSAFSALASNVVAHLPDGERAAQLRKLRSRLKRGTSPTEALEAWIHAASGPKSKVGVIAVEWTAREEVFWQARQLGEAHGVSTNWTYDPRTDETWKLWRERSEAPVDTPLRDFGVALKPTGRVLFRFAVDETVYAFAVAQDRCDEVLRLCRVLGIEAIVER